MKSLFFIFEYLKHYFLSNNEYGIHSPFVFNLYTKVIRSDVLNNKIYDIELLRKKFLSDNRIFDIKDYGAGSGNENFRISRKCIKDIVIRSSMKPRLCRLIGKLASNAKAKVILELGTSLGFSTMYLSAYCPNSSIYTIEGSEALYLLACDNFKKLNFNNIIAINDTFENVLDNLLQKIKQIDFILFDGNHRKIQTLNYFQKCLPYANEHSVFVFDDIYWSKEMSEAWNEIIKYTDVTISIDLFFVGIIFFRKGISKQHFCLRF